ncbi:MAG TPA: Rho termination factor N-terminal domain-containing protein [Solirubrobacteraceae bacterium]|nr:Rho termination factor N-terminal domain-containing protein [Solirubrobacteraceae bacterium]
MAVLERSELEASPLADLHAIANQLGLDGFRRLRKADLIDSILGDPGDSAGAEDSASDNAEEPEEERKPRSRSRGGRGVRSRSRSASTATDDDDDEQDKKTDDDADADADVDTPRPAAARRGRGRARGADSERADEPAEEEPTPRASSSRRGRGRSDDSRRGAREGSRDRDRDGGREGGRERDGGRDRDRDGTSERSERAPRASSEEQAVEGVVELLGNGSAFLRVDPPEPSDNDVYISAAQVRRCELVSGDRVAGPMRTPRRSERYPSLVRIDTINGASADSVAEGTRYDDLPVAYASERLALDSDDPTLKAIEWLTPLGRGSRAVIAGASRAGKTETLRLLLGAVAGQEDLEVTLVLTGVRPEEVAEWQAGPVAPASSLSFAASADAQGQAVERVIETAKRVAARGGHALVAIDCLDGLHPHAARKALAAARNLTGGGSLTVIGTASKAFGGETTVISLDVALTSAGRLPALDLVSSGTLRPELLVGDEGAQAIAQARGAAIDQRL